MALKTEEGGKGFWKIYSEIIRDKICDPREKLYSLFKTGLASSAGAIATSLSSMVLLPPVAVGLIVPIAAILATTGLDAFCAWSQKKEHEE